MRKIIGVIAITIALLAWAGEVQAACTTTTYFGPDGRITICTVCCSGGNCTVSCL